jgi:hypothetical protein
VGHFVKLHYIPPTGKMIDIEGIGRDLEGDSRFIFQVFSWRFLGLSKQNHEIPQSG